MLYKNRVVYCVSYVIVPKNMIMEIKKTKKSYYGKKNTKCGGYDDFG